MAMSAEQRAKQLEATREMAAAVLEDLDHFREIANKREPDRGELRRLSTALARLLIERNLAIVAAPRIGKISIQCPDNQTFHKHTRKHRLPLFCSGGANAFGIYQRAFMVNEGKKPLQIPGLDLEAKITLPVESFLRQDVLCVNGNWANRQDVIQYVRNVGFGVHSGKPNAKQVKKFEIVDNAKNCVEITLEEVPSIGEKAPMISFHAEAIAGGKREFSYNPEGIDPVLFELLCMARFIIESPDIQKLENELKCELGITS